MILQGLDLPFDVWEHVVDIIGEENGPHITDSLQNLSLTSSAMVPLCRKHLFSTLYLDDEWGQARSSRFIALISDDPEIIRHVRHLHYYLRLPLDVQNHRILDTLKSRSSSLRSIALSYEVLPRNAWDSLPISLQFLLRQLIQLPTVTHLDLSWMRNVPLTIFACGNITHISLSYVDFKTPGITTLSDSDSASQISTSFPRSLTATVGVTNTLKFLILPHQKILDFRDLSELKFLIQDTEDVQLVSDLLSIAKCLISLNLTIWGFVPMTGLGPALPSLKTLTFMPQVKAGDQDPLCGINTELAMISGINVLEEIHVGITFLKVLSLPVTDIWSAFDSLLTTFGQFPRLRTVSMEVEWHYSATNSSREEIKAEHFPMLVKDPAVEFKFSA